jgi:branched-chain amino acid transport system substrate-binding protein
MKGRCCPAGRQAFFLAAALTVLVSCGQKEPVRIGYVGGLSGRVADLGRDGRNGAILAVEARNAAGGVGGRPVELIIRDDAQDRETAIKVDRELLGLGVEAIIGHMTSSMSQAVIPIINEGDVLLVSPTTTTTYLSGLDDQFLRVTATTKEYASHMARYLREEAGIETVTLVYDLGNQAYTESWYNDFRTEFVSREGLMSGTFTFTSGPEAGFEHLALRALETSPDALVIVASALDTAMLAQQVRKVGSEVVLAASAWASTEQLLELGGKAVEGMILSQFFDRESSDPAYIAFRDHYREQFGRLPGFAGVRAYDAAMVVLEALQQKMRGESLKEAVLRIRTFQGIQGSLTFDEYGDVEGRTIVTTVREGKFQVLE